MEIVKNYNQFVNKIFSNKHFVTILSLLIALYASFAAPILPEFLIKLFNHDISKLIICFLIAYTASSNLNLSLMISLLFLLSTGLLNKIQIEKFVVNEQFRNSCGVIANKEKKDDEDKE